VTRPPKFVVEFGRTGTEAGPPAEADGRLDAPAFHRNHEAIWSALASDFAATQGDMLEIGSGTGQHAVMFAQRAPHLTWWPSDVNPRHRDSIDAWRRVTALPNLRAAADIDVSQPGWKWSDTDPLPPLAAILCANVIHIAPWAVAEGLFAGAARQLRADGRLYLYGPFMAGGRHTAPSNAAFDASLRAQNPDWGVRDIDDLRALARRNGLRLTQTHAMPANNLILVFMRG
jgi:SAM-dependent methyltransferase